MNSENEERVNQSLMKNSSFKNEDLIFNKIIKSICKIETNNHYASGFLIILKKGENDTFFLITNEHIVTKQMIKSNEKIKFYYDNVNDKNKFVELELNKSKRFIRTYGYMNIDACLIEILPSDQIDKSYFLPTPKDYKNSYEQFKDKEIGIFQFPKGRLLQSTNGKILDINLPRYELYYKISTDHGSSGSPIFLENSEEVIGIHKQGSEKKNVGNFLGPIISSLKDNLDYDENTFINGYEGEINKNQKREGFGKYAYENGEYYKGQWLNDQKNGIGIEYNESSKKIKIIYEGTFINNKYNKGILHYEDGKKYIGQFKNDKKNGIGEEYDKNNIKIYEGQFRNDEYFGKGKLYENGQLVYDGEWKNSKKHGEGKQYQNGIVIYNGKFENNEYSGHGYYCNNGVIEYVGYWKNGKKNGKGKQYYENSKLKYDGYFVDGNLEGECIYYDISGNPLYSGGWKNNKRNGIGIKYEDNKIVYEGDFIDDKFHGNGKSYYKNTYIEYDGEWKNDKRDGKGKKYYETKKEQLKYVGNFNNDEFHDVNATSYYINGNKEYEGEWKNGKKCGKGKHYFENKKEQLKYDGCFENNAYNGKGKSYYENGNIEYDGDWKNDKKNGCGTYYIYINNYILREKYGTFLNDTFYHGSLSEYDGRRKTIILKYKDGQPVRNNGCFN